MTDSDPGTSNKTVLLVDDDDFVRTTLERVCAFMDGVESLSASNVAEGYALLCGNHVDLVITDLSMPIETGLDLLRRVRGDENDVPVMVFSGSFTPGTREKAEELGATEILNKPASIEVLMATISRLLGIENSQTQE